LEHWFQRVSVQINEDDGDDNNDGELWEFKEPEAQESWTVLHSPHTEDLVFGHTFKNNTEPQALSMTERVKDVVHESTDLVRVHCETTGQSLYKLVSK
jgi:hypothetical protein